ncbi:hypothetical protein CathTA2_1985 [Caldalkalibacillus thermarum TA2.A1]|uniref:Uncharacterized protein n=1 Tax=Caldalkalibacillus thermarum (strain TA2.A1) TaxID=986075 RepID=F5L835_CALTT|nr:hypothetical protein [Caldalkalibacillus thermarum]EGL82448.1 hypothetical protein CathTA2_1985 [Caldalkalibacillus thermarum TA2.A1]QZT33199.1 hypothetical protein HUR95_12960 [Caldalkalibacillus thermarum TA2.A1]
MNNTPFGCGHMNRGDMLNVTLSAPLKQLKEEHVPLRKAMDVFYATAQRIKRAFSNG